MASGKLAQCSGLDNMFEWALPDFPKLSEKQSSELFAVGSVTWRLLCFPKQNVTPSTHLSLYLEGANLSSIPEDEHPHTEFILTVLNHKNEEKAFSKAALHVFGPEHIDWGFSQMLPLTDISVNSGYLRSDGALVIRVQLHIKSRPRKRAREVASDFLALLHNPGPTSDITLTAGGRSFPAHRAILAARSEFFGTMFASGFDDSTARELPLPDTDADALELLLQYMYGGTLNDCPRGVLKAAAELADRWRLSDALSEVEMRILNSTTRRTIIEDMLWAEAYGSEDLVADLQKAYVRVYAKQVDESSVAALAERNPRLMAHLYVMAMNAQK